MTGTTMSESLLLNQEAPRSERPTRQRLLSRRVVWQILLYVLLIVLALM